VKLAAHLVARLPGHEHIQQQHVGHSRIDLRDGSRAVRCGDDLGSSMNEKVAEQAQIRGLVVEDEHEPGVR